MLKNLIASCMIASSVNLQPLTPNKAIIHNYTATFQTTSSSQQYNNGANIYNNFSFVKYSLQTNSYMYGRAIAINQQGTGGTGYYYYAITNDDSLNYKYPITPSADPYQHATEEGWVVPAGQLFEIELDGRNLNDEVVLEIGIEALLEEATDYNSKYYIEMLYNTTNNAQLSFNSMWNLQQTQINLFAQNINIYNSMNNKKNLYVNTQTTIKKYKIDYMNTGTDEIEILVQPKVKNYYTILVQPQIKNIQSNENADYQQGQAYIDNQIPGIYISGKNIMSDANTEVIDLPGVMFEVVGMPFSFISTAFNLTIFPGTQYSINISNLVLIIFALLTFIFLLKLFLKMRG